MIHGIGIDVAEVARVAAVLGNHPERLAARVMTPTELGYSLEITPDFLARAWTVKEAVAKALGTGIGDTVSFQDITVSPPGQGKPTVTLSPRVQAQFPQVRLHLSLSHTGGIMQALVLAEQLAPAPNGT